MSLATVCKRDAAFSAREARRQPNEVRADILLILRNTGYGQLSCDQNL